MAAAMLIMSGTAIFSLQRESRFLAETAGQEVPSSFFPVSISVQSTQYLLEVLGSSRGGFTHNVRESKVVFTAYKEIFIAVLTRHKQI